MKNLKIAMIKNNLKNKDIAELLNLSKGQASRIINGDYDLTATKIKKLCKALNITADYLLELEDK